VNDVQALAQGSHHIGDLRTSTAGRNIAVGANDDHLVIECGDSISMNVTNGDLAELSIERE
jgi:hypothetical protein